MGNFSERDHNLFRSPQAQRVTSEARTISSSLRPRAMRKSVADDGANALDQTDERARFGELPGGHRTGLVGPGHHAASDQHSLRIE